MRLVLVLEDYDRGTEGITVGERFRRIVVEAKKVFLHRLGASFIIRLMQVLFNYTKNSSAAVACFQEFSLVNSVCGRHSLLKLLILRVLSSSSKIFFCSSTYHLQFGSACIGILSKSSTFSQIKNSDMSNSSFWPC